MTATYEQIEDEAHRRFDENPCTPLAHYIIEVTREGWTPPEPVDPDVLAYRAWMNTNPFKPRPATEQNRYDNLLCEVFVQGARMARAQEQEWAKVLVEYAEGDANRGDGAGIRATQALAAYKAGRTAR
jgi:hypothetical protein